MLALAQGQVPAEVGDSLKVVWRVTGSRAAPRHPHETERTANPSTSGRTLTAPARSCTRAMSGEPAWVGCPRMLDDPRSLAQAHDNGASRRVRMPLAGVNRHEGKLRGAWRAVAVAMRVCAVGDGDGRDRVPGRARGAGARRRGSRTVSGEAEDKVTQAHRGLRAAAGPCVGAGRHPGCESVTDACAAGRVCHAAAYPSHSIRR